MMLLKNVIKNPHPPPLKFGSQEVWRFGNTHIPQYLESSFPQIVLRETLML